MKKIITAIALAAALGAMPMLAGADEVGTAKLTDAQKAELKKKAAEFEVANATEKATVTTPKKVEEYVDLGSKIGQALGGAAKEMSVQVNDFAKTPVGIFTVVIIATKLIGGFVAHITGGLIVFAFGGLLMFFLYRKGSEYRIEYDPNPEHVDIFRRARKLKVVREALSNDDQTGLVIVGVVTTILAIITMFSW